MANLYLVANLVGCDTERFLRIVEAALRGGVDAVQFRAKALDDDAFFSLALSVQNLCRRSKKPLFINDRVHVAKAIDANGVHLGSSDMLISQARKILGKNAFIGYSLGLHEDVQKARGADYIGASPVFSTRTKQDAGRPYGLEHLARLVLRAPCPVVAIGGIASVTIQAVAKSGCASIAVASAIMDAPSPYDETCFLRALLNDQ